MATLYDLIQLDGLPSVSDVLTRGAGLTDVTEPLTFATQTAGELTIGDTVMIDGTTYTLSDMEIATVEIDHDNGFGFPTTTVTTVPILVLDDGMGGTLTFAAPYDADGDLPLVSAMVITGMADEPGPLNVAGDLSADNDVSLTCFARGTRIGTPQGERAIECLRVGDLVTTLDHGDQPIRWIGRRRVPATGRHAPVRIASGVLGNARDLWVSPQHRMLLTDWRAEMLFGCTEVLVPACHLLSGDRIHRAPGSAVTYIHLMCDRHEILFAEGIATESFHPGDPRSDSPDETHSELARLFPDLTDPQTGYGPAARLSLKAHEAAVLRGGPAFGPSNRR